MSPAPVAFSRESFRHCPAARLPIAAAARCCPEFPPSTPTRPPRYSRKRPRKSHLQEGRRNVAVVRRYHPGACFARWRHDMKKCRRHRRFTASTTTAMTRRGMKSRRAAACDARIIFLKRGAAKVLTAYGRAAYIGVSRCAVRLGCFCAPAKLLHRYALPYADPASDFGRIEGISTSPGLGRAGPPGPGLFDK